MSLSHLTQFDQSHSSPIPTHRSTGHCDSVVKACHYQVISVAFLFSVTCLKQMGA